MTKLLLQGRIAAVLPDNTDTDVIYPGRYLNITDREQTAAHLFELAYPDLRARIHPGDILIAGKNFGCGSSREQAAAAIKLSGVGAVIAHSFARIFYRNAINLGVPVIVADIEANEGDHLAIDLEQGQIKNQTTGRVFQSSPLDPRAIDLLEAGGLIPYLQTQRRLTYRSPIVRIRQLLDLYTLPAPRQSLPRQSPQLPRGYRPRRLPRKYGRHVHRRGISVRARTFLSGAGHGAHSQRCRHLHTQHHP